MSAFSIIFPIKKPQSNDFLKEKQLRNGIMFRSCAALLNKTAVGGKGEWYKKKKHVEY